MDVRFFVRCHDHDGQFCTVDDFEVTMGQFEGLEPIAENLEYERHTIFANGVDQICLTIDPIEPISSDEITTI